MPVPMWVTLVGIAWIGVAGRFDRTGRIRSEPDAPSGTFDNHPLGSLRAEIMDGLLRRPG